MNVSLDVLHTLYSHLGNPSQIRSACPTLKNAKNFGQAIYFQEYHCTKLRRTETVPRDMASYFDQQRILENNVDCK